jgi:hypothetical protein
VLDEKLSAVLTYKPSIFLDDYMTTGTWWKSALKHSKVLIDILVLRYFESTWCQAELGCIEEREKAEGFHQQPERVWLFLLFIAPDQSYRPAFASGSYAISQTYLQWTSVPPQRALPRF